MSNVITVLVAYALFFHPMKINKVTVELETNFTRPGKGECFSSTVT